MRTILLLGFAVFSCRANADVVQQGRTWVLTGKTYSVVFSAVNGSIVEARQAGRTESLFKSSPAGLWSIRLQNGEEIVASSFGTGVLGHPCTVRADRATNSLRFEYSSTELNATVSVVGREESLDFTAQINPRKGTVIAVEVPARLRFTPAQVTRFIGPLDGNQGVGAAFNRDFFAIQKTAVSWAPQRYADAGYKLLAGGPIMAMRGATQTDTPTSTLKVTEAGKEWLGEALAKRIEGSKALVNRPPTREQAKFTLVDSPDGPYLGAHIIGEGGFWQIGGFVGDGEAANVLDMLTAVINRLQENAPGKRTKLGVLSLDNSPARGFWTTIPMRDWLDRCRDTEGVHAGKVEVVSLTSASEIQAALTSKDYVLILNPYGEWLPLLSNNGTDDDLNSTIAAIKAFSTAGGHWIETGGYPFYYAMRPQHYINYNVAYPPAPADFMRLEGAGGAASLYGVRPAPGKPWNREASFVPGLLGWGGDVISGYCHRSYGTYVPPGNIWITPITRLAFGGTAEGDLQAYNADNGLARRLADKVPAPLLERLKNAVLVQLDGSARAKMAALDRLPTPSLIFFDDYMKGGRGREWPDVLPPNTTFGTSAELRTFLERCRQMGHLTMPYTNPTWWSDKPRGASFKQAGDGPLPRGFDGKTEVEKWENLDGFAVSLWHPAVQAANRTVRTQLAEELPTDFLFRDQVGGRTWHYDTNPASPWPVAGSDGLLSQFREDSAVRHVATDGAWDRAADSATHLTGLMLGHLPDDDVTGRALLQNSYPPATWTMWPVAGYVAHERCSLLPHLPSQDIGDPRALSWALGLGCGLSYRIAASELMEDTHLEWLRWLECVQKNVCARYIGEPVRKFSHNRTHAGSDGVVRATYGAVDIAANLEDEPLPEGTRVLSAYGFRATAPGVIAANLKTVGGDDFGDDGVSFVTKSQTGKTDVWVYSVLGREVAVELPVTLPAGPVSLTLDDGSKLTGTVQNNGQGSVLRWRLPENAKHVPRVAPPPALAGKAPRNWPGNQRKIGVLALPGLEPIQAKIAPETWLQRLSEARFIRDRGIEVMPIDSAAALQTALKAGPPEWFSIINPYGEAIPCTGAGQGPAMVAAIRAFVQNGGVWWETGGASFTIAVWQDGAKWQKQPMPATNIALSLPVGEGDDTKNTPPLHVTPTGREWLGPALAARLEGRESSVCRSLSRRARDSGHVTLLTGAGRDFIGGYRLRGWGWFFRTGGMRPNASVLLPVVTSVTDYLYNRPPAPAVDGTRYLWHAVL